MELIESEMIVYFDCDDSLCMWTDNIYLPGGDKIEFEDPYDSSLVYLIPHYRHIKLLKDYKERGYTVIIWSAAGYRWAQVVAKILELEEYIDYCQSKPIKFVDDLQASEILGDRVYIPFMGKK